MRSTMSAPCDADMEYMPRAMSFTWVSNTSAALGDPPRIISAPVRFSIEPEIL